MSPIEDQRKVFNLAESITLARETLSYFANGGLAVHPERGKNIILRRMTSQGIVSAHGHLGLSHHDTKTKAAARCHFFFPADWRREPPRLRCRERWIRTSGLAGNSSWHVNSDNSLCFVIGPQWRDQIRAVEAKHGTRTAVSVAALHAINNARWLLFHHLLGYRRKLTEWPDEWPQWPHFEHGLAEYDRVRRKGIKFSHQ